MILFADLCNTLYLDHERERYKGIQRKVGDKIENRERRGHERQNLTFSALILGKFRVKNGENSILI